MAIIESAPDCLAFDTDANLSRAQLEALWTAGFRGCALYVNLPGYDDSPTPEYLYQVLSVGFGVWMVQHVLRSWHPSAALGRTHGATAAESVRKAGYLPGGHLAMDLEDVALGVSSMDVIGHSNMWGSESRLVGYKPMLYVGFDTRLSGAQMYSLPEFACYWRSQSNVPDIPVRSYAVRQFYPSVTVGGVDVDVNVLTADKEGGRVQWMRS